MNQPLAYVHPGAKIAKNVVIEPFTTIHNNVTIGEGTWIGSNVTIMEGARIGKNCNIFPGSVISAIPQDLKYQGEETTVHIGDNTTIRECATINKGTSDRMKTVIGKNCLIMAYCHVKAAREPLSYVGINSIGLRRRGFTTEKIREIQNIFRILYQKHYNNTQAAQIIEAEMEATSERDEILQFIRDSQRGIMKGYFSTN